MTHKKPTPEGFRLVHFANTPEERIARLELLVDDILYMLGAKIKQNEPKED